MGKKKKKNKENFNDSSSTSGGSTCNEIPPTIPCKRKSSFEGFENEPKKINTSQSPTSSSKEESVGRSGSSHDVLNSGKVTIRKANIIGKNQKKIDINETIEIRNIPNYARFLYMKPINEQTNLRSFSVIIQKTFLGYLNEDIKSAVFCRNGQMLIETTNLRQLKQILKITSFNKGELIVKYDIALNIGLKKGIIYAPELTNITNFDNLKSEFNEEIIEIRRLNKGKDKIPTPLLVITFGKQKIPEVIKWGYINYKVKTYYPNPIRCFNCQRFGHNSFSCKSQPNCSKCGESHKVEQCNSNYTKCANCSEDHSSLSKDCRYYIREKEIINIKVNKDVSFSRAKEIYNQTFNIDIQKRTMSETIKTNVTNYKDEANNNIFYDQNQDLKKKMLKFTTNINKFKDLKEAVNCITDILKEIYKKPPN